jgi:hypothetical protein
MEPRKPHPFGPNFEGDPNVPIGTIPIFYDLEKAQFYSGDKVYSQSRVKALLKAEKATVSMMGYRLVNEFKFNHARLVKFYKG